MQTLKLKEKTTRMDYIKHSKEIVKAKPTFYMMVGIPYSGKSHVAEKLDVVYLSSDELRKELWGSAETQGDNSEIFSELYARTKKCLKEGQSCVLDATNISAKRRKSFLNQLKKIDCNKVCIFMATDFDVCLSRRDKRERQVPYDVVKRMYLNINIPQYREGWDKIEIIRTRDENKKYDIFETINRLENLNHDNPHHLLTVGAHIQAVTNSIINKYKLIFAGDIHRLERLITAAMYHDIGKEFTKTYVNRKGETTDVAHYYGHENVSAYLYLLYEKEKNIKDNLDSVLYVADLVGLHMRMICDDSSKDNTYQKILNLVGVEEFKDLRILNESDILCG